MSFNSSHFRHFFQFFMHSHLPSPFSDNPAETFEAAWPTSHTPTPLPSEWNRDMVFSHTSPNTPTESPRERGLDKPRPPHGLPGQALAPHPLHPHRSRGVSQRRWTPEPIMEPPGTEPHGPARENPRRDHVAWRKKGGGYDALFMVFAALISSLVYSSSPSFCC